MGIEKSQRFGVKTPEEDSRAIRELAEAHRLQDAEEGLKDWEIEILGVDHLTGLKTRKFFEQTLESALRTTAAEERRGKSDNEVALIFIDLDHFKNINDTFGHSVGDKALKKVAALLISSVRETDTAARIGGEELAVIMPGANKEIAARHAEELRAGVEKLVFENQPELKVTASFGVSSSESGATPKELYAQADKAVYAAKDAGRNNVKVF